MAIVQIIGERWRKIKRYPSYLVSTRGRVLSLNYSRKTLLSLANDGRGYFCVSLHGSMGQRIHRVHRLVAIAFLPNPHSLPQVNHIDGDKTNNNLENLEWCDASQNTQHAYDTGLCRGPVGQLNGRSILTDTIIRKIRRDYSSGAFLQRDLAKKYGVARSLISMVVTYKRWKHIK